MEQYTVEHHLRGKPAFAVALFHRFVEIVSSNGPFTYAVDKTTVVFKGTRRGFAGGGPNSRGLSGFLDLQRPIDDARVRRSAPYGRSLFVVFFAVTTPEQLDDTFAAWVGEAYQVGAGAHLRSGGRDPAPGGR